MNNEIMRYLESKFKADCKMHMAQKVFYPVLKQALIMHISCTFVLF